ncbi:MAG: riboflavin synthase [Chloroflexi bacterium]|nr:riboflavin synthase [Chloroflexota bacterium]
MFTGIVEEMGTVEVTATNSLRVRAAKTLQGLGAGDSISVNGACLTVTSVTESGFTVEVMPETLRRSSLGSLSRDDRVNLERALTVGGRIGGHLVQGHLDGTGRILSLRPEGKATLMSVSAPEGVMRYLVEKAFIAVDGVSLTVASVEAAGFTVSIVGYTLHNTTLGSRRAGEPVNLEVDIMAKYVERFTRARGSEITMDFLAEHGFSTAR